MKREITPILFAIILIANVLHVGCKKSDAVASNTLTVTVSTGVTGTPAAGSYTYNIGDTVNYSYSLLDGYSALKVLLDNVEVGANGTITISKDHTLQAFTAGNGQFTLTVTVAKGVTGTPVAGTYSYKDGDMVDYSYALENGYTNLGVSLDLTAVTSSGTIAMSSNHALAATANKRYDITGTWTLDETYNDGSTFKVTATFAGNLSEGTITDSDGGSGIYVVNSSAVGFTLVYPDVTYTYSGTLSDEVTMSGTSKRINSAGNGFSGTWTAFKTPTAKIMNSQSTVNKGSVSR